MLKILVSGGNGRFASELKKIECNFKFIFRNKKTTKYTINSIYQK